MRGGVVVAIAAAVLIAGLIIGDRVTSCSGDTVAIVGDSISQWNQQAINAGLGPAFHVRMGALAGQRTDQMLPAAKELAATRPDQALIELGTNDVNQAMPTDQTIGNLEQMIRMFKDADCVHVVTVNTHMLDSTGRSPARAQELDAAILKLPDKYPNVDLVRWDEIIAANVADHPPAGNLTKDTVHPNADGVRELVSAYRGAFEGCHRPAFFW